MNRELEQEQISHLEKCATTAFCRGFESINYLACLVEKYKQSELNVSSYENLISTYTAWDEFLRT